jgi:hypothetical protein
MMDVQHALHQLLCPQQLLVHLLGRRLLDGVRTMHANRASDSACWLMEKLEFLMVFGVF